MNISKLYTRHPLVPYGPLVHVVKRRLYIPVFKKIKSLPGLESRKNCHCYYTTPPGVGFHPVHSEEQHLYNHKPLVNYGYYINVACNMQFLCLPATYLKHAQIELVTEN